ncbi:MAG: hypothetical protein ACREBD_17450, partial [Blastocatellia bacterium]
GTIGLFRAKELVEQVAAGLSLPASDRHIPFPTPADLAGTDRKYTIGGFFQSFLTHFGKIFTLRSETRCSR